MEPARWVGGFSDRPCARRSPNVQLSTDWQPSPSASTASPSRGTEFLRGRPAEVGSQVAVLERPGGYIEKSPRPSGDGVAGSPVHGEARNDGQTQHSLDLACVKRVFSDPTTGRETRFVRKGTERKDSPRWADHESRIQRTSGDEDRSPERPLTGGTRGNRRSSTGSLEDRRTQGPEWWGLVVSNHRPLPCKGSALPLS